MSITSRSGREWSVSIDSRGDCLSFFKSTDIRLVCERPDWLRNILVFSPCLGELEARESDILDKRVVEERAREVDKVRQVQRREHRVATQIVKRGEEVRIERLPVEDAAQAPTDEERERQRAVADVVRPGISFAESQRASRRRGSAGPCSWARTG